MVKYGRMVNVVFLFYSGVLEEIDVPSAIYSANFTVRFASHHNSANGGVLQQTCSRKLYEREVCISETGNSFLLIS